jgi:cobalamin biosynthesis protein CobD/CbiB
VIRRAEINLTDIIAGLAPWLAPIPTAWLVGAATVKHLAWPVPVAIVAAAIVESLGLAATNTALELREYNQSKRKIDPPAPAWLAAGLVGGYIAIAILLTVALDVVPSQARYAPAIWPALSLTGAVILALRADHRRRLAAIAQDKAERKAARQVVSTVKRKVSTVKERQVSSVKVDSLLDAYLDNPALTPTQAAQALGVSRQTVYNYLEQLERAGTIRRNGHGVEVLK